MLVAARVGTLPRCGGPVGVEALQRTRLVLKKTGTRYDLISPVSRFRSH